MKKKETFLSLVENEPSSKRKRKNNTTKSTLPVNLIAEGKTDLNKTLKKNINRKSKSYVREKSSNKNEKKSFLKNNENIKKKSIKFKQKNKSVIIQEKKSLKKDIEKNHFKSILPTIKKLNFFESDKFDVSFVIKKKIIKEEETFKNDDTIEEISNQLSPKKKKSQKQIEIIQEEEQIKSSKTFEIEMQPELLFKILVLGDSNVGKTNLVSRFCHDKFTEDNKTTIGVDFNLYETEIDDKKITAQFWDTAGQEKYRAMSTAFYKKAQGAIIVYDISDNRSFDNVITWLNEIKFYGEENIQIILLGNKSDLKDLDSVPEEKAKNFAEEHGIFFLEVSAKVNKGKKVQIGFNKILKMLADMPIDKNVEEKIKKMIILRKETEIISKNVQETQIARQDKWESIKKHFECCST